MDLTLAQKEHPQWTPPADFHPADLPSTFEDQSWHNDTMPSFFCPVRRVVLYVDYPPELSEVAWAGVEGCGVYMAYDATEDGGVRTDPDDGTVWPYYVGDSFNDMLTAIASLPPYDPANDE